MAAETAKRRLDKTDRRILSELIANGLCEQLLHLPGFEHLAVTSGGFDFVVISSVDKK